MKLVSKHVNQMTALFNYKSSHSKYFFLLNIKKQFQNKLFSIGIL